MDIHPTKIPYPISWGPKKMGYFEVLSGCIGTEKTRGIRKKTLRISPSGESSASEFAHGVSKLGIFQSGMVKIITFPMNNNHGYGMIWVYPDLP